ncbi:MAG: aldo/keto reductase, partial [Nakamurella sp.]
LWLVHWPPNKKASPAVWEQLIKAQQDGLATSIGVSNYSLDQIDELIATTGVAPAVNQIRWSPALYDADLVAGLQQRGVILEGYSPFKASDLSDPTLASIAAAYDANTAQVIVGWHVAHGFVVIPKSTRAERIIGNAAGAHLQLSADEVAAIDRLSTA